MFSPERLRSAIDSSGLSITKFAKAAGVSRTFVYRCLAGESVPSANVLSGFAIASRKDLAYFYDVPHMNQGSPAA